MFQFRSPSPRIQALGFRVLRFGLGFWVLGFRVSGSWVLGFGSGLRVDVEVRIEELSV